MLPIRNADVFAPHHLSLQELIRLNAKGTITVGADTDLVALDATGGAQTVIIQGEVRVRDGVAIRRGNWTLAL